MADPNAAIARRGESDGIILGLSFQTPRLADEIALLRVTGTSEEVGCGGIAKKVIQERAARIPVGDFVADMIGFGVAAESCQQVMTRGLASAWARAKFGARRVVLNSRALRIH